MTKGKLYTDMEGSNSFWWIEGHLNEAKEEFPADAHGLDVEKVMPWFWKYFGDEE